LTVKKVGARLHFLYGALVLAGQPLHAVTHHGLAFFAARVAYHAPTVRGFYPYVAAVSSDYQAWFKLGCRCQWM
jgi:diphthamide biosynthesis methyltransferase